MVSVTLVNCDPNNLLLISLVRLIRDSTGKDLAEAKELLDRFVEGKPCTLYFSSRQTAGEFVVRAINLGAIVKGVLVQIGLSER